MPDSVYVVDCDPEWPRRFEALKERAVAALGDLVVVVEHVGSTAVPGLAAKPIIDLDVVVRTAADIPLAIKRLATVGYVHEGDAGIAGREAFRWPAGEPRHHLYVLARDNPELRRHLSFRDYLRAHPDVTREYGELKRRLAERFRDDRAGYTEGKTEFVARVLAKIEDTRDET
ncbi:MAG: GrpB family protein [Bacillota bacterium]